ncbi:Solute carrier family 10 member 6 (Sodium-dependent organic anion transporter) [Durusdinium trenchii]|uniref:Solute carrier family 10 member 6 (Sodium-dependent organic anion transporter) n=1 Tax=Durusdinium trenchii TaxID=1381693 RepID=A0ABP0JAW6_9DINO
MAGIDNQTCVAEAKSNLTAAEISATCDDAFLRDVCACEVEEFCSEGSTAEDIAYTVVIQVLVFLLVFGLAGSVDFGHFRQRFKSRGVYIGLLCQFILMPFIGFVVVAIFRDVLDPLYAVSLLIICASPGGSYSNWWCNLINADLALSVAMTTVSTIVSAVVLPINIILYIELGYKALSPDNAQEIVELLPYEVIAYTLANVICAVCTGLYFGYHYPHRMKLVNFIGTTAGFLSIILGVVASSTSCAEPWGQEFLVYFAVLLPLIFGLALAMGLSSLAGLPKPQRVSVAIETAYQNTGISLAVALSLGAEGRAAAIVPVMYGGYEAVGFGIYALTAWYIGWTLSPPDVPLWKAMLNSYQDTIVDHPHYKGYHGDGDTKTSMSVLQT